MVASPQPAVANPQPTPRRHVAPGLDAPRYEKSAGGRGGASAHHAQLARRGTLPQWELGRALEMGRALELGHSAGPQCWAARWRLGAGPHAGWGDPLNLVQLLAQSSVKRSQTACLLVALVA